MELTRADLLSLLYKLATRLTDLGIHGTLRIVGGAAIALNYANRPPTHDIDADFLSDNASESEIRQVVEELAIQEELTPQWLNPHAMVFLPKNVAADWIAFAQIGDVHIVLASPTLLLSMKLQANRGGRDTEDIVVLMRVCDVESLEQAEAIYGKFNEGSPLSQGASELVSRLLSK